MRYSMLGIRSSDRVGHNFQAHLARCTVRLECLRNSDFRSNPAKIIYLRGAAIALVSCLCERRKGADAQVSKCGRKARPIEIVASRFGKQQQPLVRLEPFVAGGGDQGQRAYTRIPTCPASKDQPPNLTQPVAVTARWSEQCEPPHA